MQGFEQSRKMPCYILVQLTLSWQGKPVISCSLAACQLFELVKSLLINIHSPPRSYYYYYYYYYYFIKVSQLVYTRFDYNFWYAMDIGTSKPIYIVY